MFFLDKIEESIDKFRINELNVDDIESQGYELQMTLQHIETRVKRLQKIGLSKDPKKDLIKNKREIDILLDKFTKKLRAIPLQ